MSEEELLLENLKEWEEDLAGDTALLNGLDQNSVFYNQDCDFYRYEIANSKKMIDNLCKRLKVVQQRNGTNYGR